MDMITLKRINAVVVCLLGTVLLGGCATSQADSTARDGERALDTRTPQTPSRSKPRYEVYPAPYSASPLRLRLVSGGATDNERRLAGLIVNRIVEDVGDAAKVVSEGKGEIQMTVIPSLRTMDSSGDYCRMACEVRFELEVPVKHLLGMKTVRLPDGRKLGQEAAERQFVEPASAVGSKWCQDELKTIVGREVGVETLMIKAQRKTLNNRKMPEHREEGTAIADKLATVPNLLGFEYVGQDSLERAFSYRIVYLKSAYPNGIQDELTILLNRTEPNP